MNHISCPAILVECGFMSNGEEVSLLLTASYQKKIAAALTGACLQYLQMTA
jgi:N-acetylmuramoyl-L-alanine amidase